MRSELTGTRAVFRFTLAQFLKGKSTIVTMIVMVVTVMVSMLVASVSMRGAYGASEIRAVAFENQTDYAINAADIAAVNPAFDGLREDASGATVSIRPEGMAFIVEASGDYTSDELSALENAALAAFNAARAGGTGSYSSRVLTIDEYRNPVEAASEDDFTARFTVSYAYSILVLVLVMFSTSYIVRAVLEEKASKLVELLMISVKPLALVLGKILASMCLVLIEMGLIVVSVLGAMLFSKYVLHSSTLLTMFSTSGALSAFTELNAFAAVAVIVSILLAYFTFSIVAGISGASCSDMEDMNRANMAVVLLAMFGYLASTVFMGFPASAVAVTTSLIPILSIFVAPARYLLGEIGLGVLLGSWAIQIIVILLLGWFGRRIYASLIMHRGERIKFRRLFTMAKGGERA